MLANHTRHSLPFVLLLLLSLLLPQALAESGIQVKILDDPLAIEMPADLDQIVLIEAKYVAIVKGTAPLFGGHQFHRIMRNSGEELGSFLTKQYGRTILHYINGQPYSSPGSFQLALGFMSPMYGPPPRWGPGPMGPGMPGMFGSPGPAQPPMEPGMFGPPGRSARPPIAPGMWGPMPDPPARAGVPQPGPRRPFSPRTSRRRRSDVQQPFRAQPDRLDPSDRLIHEFRILADTPERAEQLARALIDAYNNYVQLNRRRLQDWLTEREARLPKLQLALEKAQEEEGKVSQQLSSLESVPQQVYEELKTKEWSLRVEMAGVEGRLKAAKKLTASSTPSLSERDWRRNRGSRPTTVENDELITQVAERISITAQIELAGLLEQLNKIDEFLNTYRHYAQLTAKKKSASGALDEARKRKDSTERKIKSQRKCLEEELLPFELTEPVQIRPIEWTKPS